MEGYNPEVIANAKAKAVEEYRDAKRSYDRTERLRNYEIDKAFLQIDLDSNKKVSIEDRKARSRLSTEVIALNVELEKEREKLDKAYVELERIETKIQMILDNNALKRTEMKLGTILTWESMM